MQRTCRIEDWALRVRLSGRDEVVVPAAVRHPQRGLVDCRGARLLGGSLRRDGLSVRYEDGPFSLEPVDGPARDPNLARIRVLSYLDHDGRTSGLAVAAGSPEAAARADRVLDEWAAVMRTRRVVTGGLDSLCNGARQALGMLEDVLESVGGPVFVLGGLEVGSQLAGRLVGRGAVFVSDVDEVPDGARVLLGPSGVALGARAQLAARGLPVVDTLCPLAAAAHGELRRLAERGETVVVVGRPGSAALPGLLGQAPESVHLVGSVHDVGGISVADPGRVAVVLQPGLPIEDAEPVAEAVRARFGHVVPQHPATYCHAASDRRRTMASLAPACDVVLVVGPRPDAEESLAQVEAAGGRAYPVAGPEEVLPWWLDRRASVGVTAAPGTAPAVAEEVVRALTGLGPCAVRRQASVTAAHILEQPLRSR